MAMAYNIIIPVFLVVLIGYLLGKFYKKLNIDTLVFLLVYITVPCIIFTSLVKSELLLKDLMIIAIATSLIVIITGLIIFLFLRITRLKHNGLYLPLTIGNTGYLGYPISMNAFGSDGLTRAIVYDNIASIFLFSIGIYIVNEKNDVKEVFRLPLIYALLFGILFIILGIKLPSVIITPLEMIGSITIPLALIVLGYRISMIRISHIGIALPGAMFKLIGGFLIAHFVVSILSINGLTRSVILLQSAMPSAVMSMILCQKYKCDSEIVTSIVMLSTLLSIITIPIVLMMIY